MDIDFHFGTIYVLSRWAGFESDTAKIIATSSQLVDDNVSGKVPGFKFDDIPQRFSGHELWQNLREKSNVEVKLHTMVLDINQDKTIYAINSSDGIIEIKTNARF